MLPDRFSSKPVHLFVFTRQHLVWRYCTADRDLVIGGLTYVAAQIERGEIKQTVERAKDKLSIKFAYLLDPAAPEYPATQVLGDNWWPYIPTDTVNVVCLAYDAGTGAAPDIEWMGEVTQPKLSDAEMELVCEPNNGFARARNQGPKWQRGCWKTVYSTGPRGCNLVGTAREVVGVVTKVEAVAGDVPPRAHVVVPELADVLTGIIGKQANWTTVGVSRQSQILDAFTAYSKRVVQPFPDDRDDTTFHWAPIGNRYDNNGFIGPFPIWIYYQRFPAIVLADATGLSVGSSVSINLPKIGVDGVVTAVSGSTVTAVGFVASQLSLAGGFLTFRDASGLLIRRDVAAHSVGAASLQLQAGGRMPALGDAVTALPTCPRTWAACEARMNTANFGGSVYKPVKNPMDGVSMSWG